MLMSEQDFAAKTDADEQSPRDLSDRPLPPRIILHELLAFTARSIHNECCRLTGVDPDDEISLHQAGSAQVKPEKVSVQIGTADTVVIRFIEDERALESPSQSFLVMAACNLYSDGSPHVFAHDEIFLDHEDYEQNDYILYTAPEMYPLLVHSFADDKIRFELRKERKRHEMSLMEFETRILARLQERQLVYYLSDAECASLIEVFSVLQPDLKGFIKNREDIASDLRADTSS